MKVPVVQVAQVVLHSVSIAGIFIILLNYTSAFHGTGLSCRQPIVLEVATTPFPTHHTNTIFEQDRNSYLIRKENTGAIFKWGKGDKERIINPYGLWCAAVALLTGPLWMITMTILNNMSKVMVHWDPHKSLYDTTGKVWSRLWLRCINCYPTISGNVKQVQEHRGPCLYVANHASFMDIPVLCTVLRPVFKFIAKGELRNVPCIGQQLTGGKHILIDRDDRKSQLRTFKECINWLKRGVPIMAFPEGKRSIDGRLIEFKKGIFSMAVKMNAPIIPITISHTNAIMPEFALVPIQQGNRKIHVHINDPIDPNGRSEVELETLVRQVFLRTVPLCQLPLEDSTS